MHDSVWVSTGGLAPAPALCDPPRLSCAHDALVYEWDLVSDRLAWSGDVGRVLGALAPDALKSGDGFAQLVTGDSSDSRFLAVQASAPDNEGAGTRYRAIYRLRRRAAAPIAVEDCGRVFVDGCGRPLLARGLLRAIDGGAESVGLLNRNRAEFLREVDGILRSALARSTPFALLTVALAAIPDTEIPRALLRGMRFGDRLAWIADGRYALFLRADRQQTAAFARRLIDALAHDGLQSRVGVALAGHGGRGAHCLLERAAMALVTSARRDTVAFHSPSRRTRFRRRAFETLGDEIVKGLNDHRIGLARRPSLALGSAAPPIEGLAWLRREDGRKISSLEMRAAASGGELADLLDVRLLELALAALAREPDLILTYAPTTDAGASRAWLVRLVADLSSSPSIAARLVVTLKHFGENNLDGARRIKRLGARLAVDGFSAAPDALTSLRGFGVDLVKIDGALMQNLARSSLDRLYLREIVDAATRLGMATFAKGAAEAETLRQLKSLGVDFAQGEAFEWVSTPAQIVDREAIEMNPPRREPRAFRDALSLYSPAYPAVSAFR